jgi:hypothetical protein
MVKLVRELNENADWRLLYGKPSDHLKDHELILRFLAFRLASDTYKRPLKGFLNQFLEDHRDLQGIDQDAIQTIFSDTCQTLARAIGKKAFRVKNQVNAALVDSVMYGVAKRLESGRIKEPDELEKAYASLVSNKDFVSAIGRATADEERVRRRLGLATKAFSAVR